MNPTRHDPGSATFTRAASSVWLVAGVLALATMSACGPFRSRAARSSADAEIQAACAAGAVRTSTYEVVGAEAYLEKANEVSGRGEFETAIRLANRSHELASKARTNARTASKPRETP